MVGASSSNRRSCSTRPVDLGAVCPAPQCAVCGAHPRVRHAGKEVRREWRGEGHGIAFWKTTPCKVGLASGTVVRRGRGLRATHGHHRAAARLRHVTDEEPGPYTLLCMGLFCKRANRSEDQPKDTGGDDRYDASARELFHEQVSKAGLDRLQRSPGNPQLIAECRFAWRTAHQRLSTLNRRPGTEHCASFIVGDEMRSSPLGPTGSARRHQRCPKIARERHRRLDFQARLFPPLPPPDRVHQRASAGCGRASIIMEKPLFCPFD
jgi:hypothetical protein